VTNATNTRTQYVIFIALSRQQWLRERAWKLRLYLRYLLYDSAVTEPLDCCSCPLCLYIVWTNDVSLCQVLTCNYWSFWNAVVIICTTCFNTQKLFILSPQCIRSCPWLCVYFEARLNFRIVCT
jgi:hypothetical protein